MLTRFNELTTREEQDLVGLVRAFGREMPGTPLVSAIPK